VFICRYLKKSLFETVEGVETQSTNFPLMPDSETENKSYIFNKRGNQNKITGYTVYFKTEKKRFFRTGDFR